MVIRERKRSIGKTETVSPLTTMNTTTAERKQRLQDRRTAHHQALAALHVNPATADGLRMWRALRKLENKTSNAATAQCNGCRYADQNYRSEAEWSRFKTGIKESVAAVFGGSLPAGFFINGDPRGYALKIDDIAGTGAIPEGMHTDFGGYGILAPEVND